jgi:hypothetical protein
MRLNYPKTPPKIRELAYRALNFESLRHPHEERAPSLTARSNAFSHVPDLHRIFSVTPIAIAAGKDLGAAKHTSWYDVVVLSGMSHGVEIAKPRGRDAGRGTYVHRGNTVDTQLAVLSTLASEPGAETFEVRVLRIPLIAPFSFWLKAKEDANDRIVPVVSTTSQLQVGKSYSPADFFNAIRAIARNLVATKFFTAPPAQRVKRAKAARAS